MSVNAVVVTLNPWVHVYKRHLRGGLSQLIAKLSMILLPWSKTRRGEREETKRRGRFTSPRRVGQQSRLWRPAETSPCPLPSRERDFGKTVSKSGCGEAHIIVENPRIKVNTRRIG